MSYKAPILLSTLFAAGAFAAAGCPSTTVTIAPSTVTTTIDPTTTLYTTVDSTTSGTAFTTETDTATTTSTETDTTSTTVITTTTAGAGQTVTETDTTTITPTNTNSPTLAPRAPASCAPVWVTISQETAWTLVTQTPVVQTIYETIYETKTAGQEWEQWGAWSSAGVPPPGWKSTPQVEAPSSSSTPATGPVKVTSTRAPGQPWGPWAPWTTTGGVASPSGSGVAPSGSAPSGSAPSGSAPYCSGVSTTTVTADTAVVTATNLVTVTSTVTSAVSAVATSTITDSITITSTTTAFTTSTVESTTTIGGSGTTTTVTTSVLATPTCTNIVAGSFNYAPQYVGFDTLNPNNAGNDNTAAPPASTTFPGTQDVCTALQNCGDYSAGLVTSVGNGYFTYNLQFIDSSQSWFCIAYYDTALSTDYNVDSPDVDYSYGYTAQ